MEALSSRAAVLPNFSTLAALGRRVRAQLVERKWGQFPISVARKVLQPLPDRAYLALGHLCYFGAWPDYANPRTFNEHIQEYMLRCRDPLLRVAADKVLCREYIASRVGAAYLVPMLGVWDRAEAVPLEDLQRPCVLKPSAASGLVLLLRPGDARAPAELRRILRGWLRRDYSRLHREWAYRDLPRRIIAETMLHDRSGENVPLDYKAYVIGGEVRFFQLDRGRFTNHTRNLYTRDWQLMPARWSLPNHAPDSAPAALAEMVALAEQLARPFEFLRVDFYQVDGRVYVGELTNYPGAGFERFIPHAYADAMGALWKRPGDSSRPAAQTASRN